MSNTEKHWCASFSTNSLLAITPFRRMDDFGWGRNLHAIRIEPCPEGGILLIATDGTAMGVALDPKGNCTAPMTVYLPADMVDACKPPESPTLWVEGDTYSPKLPAWMIPTDVVLTDFGCMVCHGSKKTEGVLHQRTADLGNIHRESDYRLIGDKFPDWRKAVPASSGREIRNLAFNPDMVAKFQAASRISSDCTGPDGLMMYGQEDEKGPVVVRCRTYPNFWGMFMPVRRQEPVNDAIPSWLASPGKETDHE